uniref:Uncharacterized protein n=1 Tax=Solanum tuberosum TaxID=4113 RepID=M1DDY6_SOLTU
MAKSYEFLAKFTVTNPEKLELKSKTPYNCLAPRIGDVSLGEDKENLQQLLFFLPHGGNCVFYLPYPVVLLVALVPV